MVFRYSLIFLRGISLKIDESSCQFKYSGMVWLLIFSGYLKFLNMSIYSPEKTAIIVVDPFNDFLSEGGKLFSYTKEMGGFCK